MRIEPCTATHDSILHQGCRPVRLLALQNSWTLDRTLGIQVELATSSSRTVLPLDTSASQALLH